MSKIIKNASKTKKEKAFTTDNEEIIFNYPVKMSNLILLYALVIISVVGIKIKYHYLLEGINLPDWVSILIDIGISLLIPAVTTIIIYFKFLKHIPEETEKKVNTLLNQRLNYEATNHNAVMAKIDSEFKPENSVLSDEHKGLSKEHEQMQQKIDYIRDKAMIEDEHRKNSIALMNTNQKVINESVANLSDFASAMNMLLIENHDLKQKNKQQHILIQQLQADRQVSKEPQRERESRYEIEL